MEKDKCTPIQTFITFDLETTGLFDKPRRITEIALVATLREHILGFENDKDGVALPRVLSKICVCVNPMKMISTSAIEVSGLSNEILVSLKPFDEDLFNILYSFIKRFPQPVCLIAHNGNGFDFPILRYAIQKIGKAFPDYVLCADSYLAFKELLKKDNLKKMMNEVPCIPIEDEKASVNENEMQGIAGIDTDVDLFKDIVPLQSESKQSTNCKKVDDEESEHNEIYVDGYEIALCKALETIESSFLNKEHDKNGVNDELDASVEFMKGRVQFGNVENNENSQVFMQNGNKKISLNHERTPKSCIGDITQLDETRSIQETIEKTPTHSIQQIERKSNIGVDTPTKGKRTGEFLASKARKRLNFSPEKDGILIGPKSFKLGDLYRFILKREPKDCHRAENDCLILLECIVGMKENFLQWVDNNAIQLNTIKPEMTN